MKKSRGADGRDFAELCKFSGRKQVNTSLGDQMLLLRLLGGDIPRKEQKYIIPLLCSQDPSSRTVDRGRI